MDMSLNFRLFTLYSTITLSDSRYQPSLNGLGKQPTQRFQLIHFCSDLSLTTSTVGHQEEIAWGWIIVRFVLRSIAMTSSARASERTPLNHPSSSYLTKSTLLLSSVLRMNDSPNRRYPVSCMRT